MGNFYAPESAMAIVAHPDDIEYSCAGTMIRWAKAGSRICYVLCTSSEKGMTKENAAKIREAEQLKAAEIAGVEDVVFLREPDGLLQSNLELRRKLVRQIRRFRPEVVVTGDPTIVWSGNEYINHPDHRAAAAAALDATFPAAGQPNLFEELEEEGYRAFKPRKVFVTTWTDSDIIVSIDDSIDTKIKALRAHVSQMNDRDPEPRIKEWAASRAKCVEANYAETFRVVTLVRDKDWEKSHGEVLSGN
jgi:LmbE family N-acetylglucosaminyl deacetylase